MELARNVQRHTSVLVKPLVVQIPFSDSSNLKLYQTLSLNAFRS